ncbi:MAG: hypothetical protein IKC34_00325 [Clostridia bacterium]|nr:hypothetical protein [Clostridia bacterium]
MIGGQQISLIFTGIFLILTVLGLLKGFGRGAGRQTVRAVTIVISAIISLMAIGIITRSLSDLCAGKTLDEVVMMLGVSDSVSENVMDLLSCFDAVTAERIIELPLMTVVSPIVFSLLFVLVSAVLLIVHGIICSIFRLSGKRAGVASRLIGMTIGAVQGIAVAIIFLVPFMSIIGVASDTNDGIVEHHPENAEELAFCQMYDEYVRDTRESPAFKVAYSLGGDLICDSLATIDIEGENVNLRDTLSLMLVATDDFIELGEFDWTNPTEKQCDALENIIDKLSHETYVASILSGTMRGLATSIDSGVIVFELEEPVLGVMNSLVSVFTTLNEENFGRDMDTILDVYLLLAKEKVLETLAGHPEDITAAFIAKDEAGETVIKRVIATVQSNPHMKPLVTMLTKLSLSIMMNDVGVENGEEVYDTIKDGITDVIAIDRTQYETEEEYVTAVSDSLDKTLREHDIALASDIVDNMAKYLASQEYSNLSGEEVTEDEVNDVIFSYYEAYLQYVNGGGENPFPELDLGGESGEGGNGNGDKVESGNGDEGGDATFPENQDLI